MRDIGNHCLFLDDGIKEHDCREKDLSRESIEEYVEIVQQLNNTILDIKEVKHTFVNWIGSHLRDAFSDDITIHINKVGNELIFQATTFEDYFFYKLCKLGLNYRVCEKMVECDEVFLRKVQVTVELW